MAISFPTNPQLNDVFNTGIGINFVWDGTKWRRSGVTLTMIDSSAGVPEGGTNGQALLKASDNNFDTIWGNVSGGGGGLGAVIFVNDTDSPYTVSADEQLAVNTINGVVNLTAPASGTFAVADIGSNADLNNIVIDFTAKNLIFNSTTYTTFNHDLNNSQLVFVDDGTNYRVFG